MDRTDKVSIIVTVRNEDKNISILLDALLKQTYKFEEIVINDNGSSDWTVEIIEDYQKRHKHIKLIKSIGRSIGEGRNTAIRNSCGDILAVIDAGMYPEKTWLERVVTPLMENQSLDVAWGHVIFDTKSRVIPSTDLSLALVLLTKYPEDRKDGKNVSSSAFRKHVWEDMNGFPEIQLPIEDLLLIDAIEKRGFKKIYINDAKAYYFNYPKTSYDVYKKWIVSAYSSFIVRKSERGFYRQVIVFSVFFCFIGLMVIDIKMIGFVLLYIILFLINKMRLNKELSKVIFSSPKLLKKVLNLFFILNVARLYGAIKAIAMIATGKVKKLKIIEY